MEKRLEGAVALVVGGGADGPAREGEDLPMGNGRAIALRLAREGARVAVADRNVDAAAGTVESLATSGLAIETNVLEPDACRRAVETAARDLGDLDIVICNVGVGSPLGIDELDVDEWQRVVDINVRSHWLTAQAALPGMLERGHGSMVFISSVAGLRSGGFSLAYETTKAAIPQIAAHIAVRYGAQGIRANVVAPGLVNSTMVRRKWNDMSARERIPPMRRQGTPEEVSGAVAFLAGPDASYVNGVTLPVDGGVTAASPRNSQDYTSGLQRDVR